MVLKRHKQRVAFQRETTYRLDPTTLSEDDLLPFDIFDEFDLPENFKDFTEFWAVNAGRNVSDIIDEGYPPVDGTLNFEMQTGISTYFALGECVTTAGREERFAVTCEADVAKSLQNKYWLFTLVNDDNGSDKDYYVWYNVATEGVDPAVASKTGVEVAIAEDAIATVVATATAAAIDALPYIGCAPPGAAVISCILVNLGLVTDVADGDTGWAGANFTVAQQGIDNLHTITEDDDADLPSIAIYYEQAFAVEALQNLIGAVTSELTITMAKDAHVKGAWSVRVPKSIVSDYEAGTALATWAINTVGDGIDVTTWPTFYHKNLFNAAKPKLKVFTFDDVVFTLTLDAGDFLGGGAVDASAWPCERCEIKITNEIELLPQMGDPSMTDQSLGERKYEITMFIFPATDILRLLRKADPNDYYCTLTVRLQRSIRDYVEFVFSRLKVNTYPNKIPSMADKSLGVEVVFGNNILGTGAINVKDPFGKVMYEVV